jgi:hypothetical protein
VLVVIWPAGDRHDPKPLHSCPTAFQLSIARFEDGLTLDSFAQSVGKVFKTELNAIWVFQEHFKPNNGGRGPRFDFKKFGF